MTGAFAPLGAHPGCAAPARVRPLGARPRRLDGGRAHRRRAGDDSREPGGRLRRGGPLPRDGGRPRSPARFPGRRWCASTPTASPRCSSPPPLEISPGHLALAAEALRAGTEAFRVREGVPRAPVEFTIRRCGCRCATRRTGRCWGRCCGRSWSGPTSWSGSARTTAVGIAGARLRLDGRVPLLLEDELARVLRDAVHAHLVVQVRAGGAAGVAHRARPAGRASPGRRPSPSSLRQVAVAGLDAVAVVDDQHVAVAALEPGEHHRAVRRRDDFLAVRARRCPGPRASRAQPCTGRAAAPKSRGHPAAGRPDRGRRGEQRLLVLEVRLQLLEALLLPGRPRPTACPASRRAPGASRWSARAG